MAKAIRKATTKKKATVRKPTKKKATTRKKATAKKPPAKRGRPPLKFDPKEIQKLAAISCTNKEIADFLGCSEDTIERNYAGALKKGRGERNQSLRRAMWKKAMGPSGNGVDGHQSSQIFLAKNILGMSDRAEIEIHGNASEVSQEKLNEQFATAFQKMIKKPG